jgi:hypothetical protein
MFHSKDEALFFINKAIGLKHAVKIVMEHKFRVKLCILTVFPITSKLAKINNHFHLNHIRKIVNY